MTRFSELPTLGDQVGRPQPKDKARVVDRDAQRKADSQREVKFRNHVWRDSKYVCAFCGRRVKRTIELTADAGHVDHIKPRSTSPALKFDPKNGRVLCANCHQKRHGSGR